MASILFPWHFLDLILSLKWFLELKFLIFEIFKIFDFGMTIFNLVPKKSAKSQKSFENAEKSGKSNVLSKLQNQRNGQKTSGIDFSWVLHYSFFLFHMLKVSEKKIRAHYLGCSVPPRNFENMSFCTFWGTQKWRFWGMFLHFGARKPLKSC